MRKPSPLWKRILAGGLALGAGVSLDAAQVALAAEGGHAPRDGDIAAASDVEDPDFALVRAAFEQGGRLAGPAGNTQAERDRARADFAGAEEALARLRDRGRLGTAEVDLLLAERKLVETDIFRNPPTDSMVKCYDMQSVPMGTEGLTRVEARLDALERVAAQGKIRPETLARVRDRLLSDLDMLARADDARPKGDRGMFRTKDEADRAKEVLARARGTLGTLDRKTGR